MVSSLRRGNRQIAEKKLREKNQRKVLEIGRGERNRRLWS